MTQNGIDVFVSSDPDPRNAYRNGYTRIWTKDGGWFDLMPGSAEEIERACEGTSYWVRATDIFGSPFSIARVDVRVVIPVSIDVMDACDTHEEFAREKRPNWKDDA